MPELPEVEVVARELRTALVGARFDGKRRIRKDVFLCEEGLSPARLKGKEIRGVWRRGKLLGLDLSGELTLTIHLRMTGRLWVAARGEEIPAHTHIRLGLASGEELRFRDQRRFGRFQLLSSRNLGELPFLRQLGPEPFMLGLDDFERRLRGRSGSIKGALLNQHVVAGLGNIYVDEILFATGIHPLMHANRLKSSEREAILLAMRLVLERAIELGGSTIRDYAAVSGEPGSYQGRHQVFGRAGLPCGLCGHDIVKIKVAGRGTHLCATCQPLRRRKARPGMRSGEARA